MLFFGLLPTECVHLAWGLGILREDLQRIRASGLAAPVTPEGRQPIPSILAAGAQLPILQKVGIFNKSPWS